MDDQTEQKIAFRATETAAIIKAVKALGPRRSTMEELVGDDKPSLEGRVEQRLAGLERSREKAASEMRDIDERLCRLEDMGVVYEFPSAPQEDRRREEAGLGGKTMDRETLTVQEAAARLGLGRISGYNAVKSGQLPALRFGRRLLISKAVIDRMLSGERQNEEGAK